MTETIAFVAQILTGIFVSATFIALLAERRQLLRKVRERDERIASLQAALLGDSDGPGA